MWKLAKRDFSDKRVTTLVYSLISIGLLALYISLFPSIKAQSSNYQQLFSSFPAAFQKAFNVDTSIFTTLEGFLATEKFSITWQVLAILLASSRAAQSISGEIERGTMGFLLAQPVTRTKLYWAKYLSGLTSIIIFVLASTLVTIPLAGLMHVDYQAHHYFLLMVLCLLFSWAIYCVAFLLSSVFSDRSRVYFIVGGSLVAMYVVEIISKLKESLNFLSRYTLFHYFDVTNTLVHGRFSATNALMFGVIIIISSIAGVVVFNKRDIAN